MTKHEQIIRDLLRKKILVTGLTRNNGANIRNEILHLNEILQNFTNLHWLVIESDSNDNTAAELHALTLIVENFNFISLGNLITDIPLRTARISHCRNTYLNEIKKNEAYANLDYVIVVDLDGMNDLLTEESVLSCWDNDNWDVCGANQRGPYYDIWALRHDVWSPNDCWELEKFLEKYNLGQEKSLFGAVYSRMLEIPESSTWIEVDSAFGGIAIYRADAIRNARYIGLDQSGGEICEHVGFHKTIRDNGFKIFINPKFINAAYTEHTQHLKPKDGEETPLNSPVIPSEDPMPEIAAASNEASPPKQMLSSNMTSEDVIAAYKIFLRRMPENLDVIAPRIGMTPDMMLVHFLTSTEFIERKGVDRLLLGILDRIKANKTTR